MIQPKRIYEKPGDMDGYRILVERLWPRGITRERAKVDLWLRDAGASSGLRKWFGHDPAKWDDFRRKYFEELSKKPATLQELTRVIREKPMVSFLFAAHDTERNNAVALKEYIESLR